MSLSPSLQRLLRGHSVGGSAWEVVDSSGAVTGVTGYAMLVDLPRTGVGATAEFTPDQRWQFVCGLAQSMPIDVLLRSVADPSHVFWIINTTRQRDAVLCELEIVDLPDTCTVLRPTETTNVLREVVWTPAVHLDDLPCRFKDLDGNELIAAQRIDTRSTARLHVALGTDIAADDLITVLDTGYAVTFVHPATAYRTSLAVDIRRQEGQS